MITLITGVPGSGKTALVVQMIIEELKKGRVIYCVGIPDLIAHHKIPDDSCPDGFRYFAVEKAGNPLTWQKGSWLRIQTYDPKDFGDVEFGDEQEDASASAWSDNEHSGHTKTVKKTVKKERIDRETGEITLKDVEVDEVVSDAYPDQGALVIIDECQTYFRPRSTSAAVPDYIAAFEVHRHQGLDFWLLTQRPALIDGNLRGLVSKHIHIRVTAFGRKKYEWPECQNPDSTSAKAIANTSSYKPNPRVFDLYQSAQVHTKLKVKLPNGIYILLFCFVALCLSIAFLYSSFSKRLHPVQEAQASINHVDSNNSIQSHDVYTNQNPVSQSVSVVTDPPVPPVPERFFSVTAVAKMSDRTIVYVRDSISGKSYEIRPSVWGDF